MVSGDEEELGASACLCLGNRKDPIPQKWPHQDRPNAPQPLSCLGEENQYTEHKTFRVGSEGAASTPGRRWVTPRWSLFGTAGGLASSPHPTGAAQWGGCCPSPEVQHRGCQLGGTSGTQDFHPTDSSLRAGEGPAVVSQGRAAASLDPGQSCSHQL